MNLEGAYREIWAGKLPGQRPPAEQSIDRVNWTASLFRRDVAGESLLDLGTGSGAMLAKAKAVGMLPMGTDIDDPLIEWLRDQGYFVHKVDLNGPLPFSQHFGVVTACDVIEHLWNPGHMLSEALRVLKPGGIGYFATPNCANWRRVQTLASGTMFRTSGDPYLKDGGHLAYYAPSDLEDAVMKAGFKSCSIRLFKEDPCPPKVWTHLAGLGARKQWAEHTYMIAEAVK